MKKNIKFSKEVQEYCIGFFLGDGYLFKIKNGNNCSLSISHGLKQEKYLKWKHELLKDISRDIKYNLIKDKSRGNVYHIKGFYTRVHKFFTRYWKLLYKNGKKVLPERVLKKLTPISLASWIMDDGCLYENNKKRKTSNYNYTLATHCFEQREIELLQTYLEKKFNIESKIHKDRGKFKLWFNTPNSIKIAKIISPHIPEGTGMRYKVQPIIDKYNVKSE